jgi:type I restriction enzyme R subunit
VTPPGSNGPEKEAREEIDAALTEAGCVVQHRKELNISAGRGVAVREFKLKKGHGYADYLLYVDQKAVGVLEAKPKGHTLSGVEIQARKYSEGLPEVLKAPVQPLPFLYLSNGVEKRFTNLLDPESRSGRLGEENRDSVPRQLELPIRGTNDDEA